MIDGPSGVPDAQAPNVLAGALRIQEERFPLPPDAECARFERIGEAEIVRIEIFAEEVHARSRLILESPKSP
jgi:hypothetical protein